MCGRTLVVPLSIGVAALKGHHGPVSWACVSGLKQVKAALSKAECQVPDQPPFRGQQRGAQKGSQKGHWGLRRIGWYRS